MVSQTKTLRQIAACMAIILGVVGCSNNDNKPAPISSADIEDNNSSCGGMLSSPPSNISSFRNASIAIRDGRIVYNHSYTFISKGSYSGSTYTVKRGDTLFYIAWITGSDYRELAQRNNVSEPYNLNIGQVLQVGDGSSAPVSAGFTRGRRVLTSGISRSGGMLPPSSAARGGVSKSPSMTKIQTTEVDFQSNNVYSESFGRQNIGKILPPKGVVKSSTTTFDSWRWPTEGKVIDSFSAWEGGNKGIDIAGSLRQPIIATASGSVVYAGNALRGYGNLIIIKHDNDYLSAYAHNETILVREQQEIKAGQQIATMGSTGTSSVRLHFEIRYKGKSVNPVHYLPQR
ncbi:MAG: murein hydrolase activator NlpD [Candidatus Malihini olakiniferum]